MAEFCKECAKELGFYEYDKPPLFCEHCSKLIEKESLFKKTIKNLKRFWSFFKKLINSKCAEKG